MSVQLLDKIRRINRLLHFEPGNVVSFEDVCRVLSAELKAQVVVISGKGKILGVGQGAEGENQTLWKDLKRGNFIDSVLNERLQNILSTQDNANLAALGFDSDKARVYRALVAPVEIARVRLGSLFIFRREEPFDVDEIILTEHTGIIIGLEMRRSLNEESAAEIKNRQLAHSVAGTLSSAEVEAVGCILEELEGGEGILVPVKLADRSGISRSMILKALRKLESAEIVESRSSGMKGTYIRVLNSFIGPEIEARQIDKKQ